VVTAFNTYPPGKNERHSLIGTPHGDLTQTWKLSEEAAADFISEYWWKSWEEYPAIRHVVEHTEYLFDAAAFRAWKQRAGDDGVMMVHLAQSPLKTFHWLAGPENASLFAVDHPREMRELAEIHEAKVLALLEEIVDEPAAEVFISLDNLDSAFFPPGFYRDYCGSYFSRVAELIHSRGKIFVVHACGRNKTLLPLVGASRVDCLEGLTPPPMGDVLLHQARAMSGYENFTVNGGMDAPRLEMNEGAQEALDLYVCELFRSMGDKRHFIFASSCSTPYPASWDNLRRLRDAALECGRM
jgi:uroporphyrinogen-III decarboxylase